MSKKLRYGLIATGFLVFLVLAPLIVLYVRGVDFDFQKHQFVQTGILAIRAEPKDAKVLLDGKLASSKAKDIKFLFPREYAISLQREGYQTWEKRLPVIGSQVTWASPVGGQIFLFSANPLALDQSGRVLDFELPPNGNRLVFLTPESLVITSVNDFGAQISLPLPRPMAKIISSPSGDQLILQNASSTAVLFADVSSRQIEDLTGLFAGPAQWLFAKNGKLYALYNSQLFLVDAQKTQKTLLQKDIKAVAFLNNDLYYLKQKNGALVFGLTSDPAQEGQDIIKNLPLFNKAEIVVSFEKLAYIIGDGTLYKASATLQPLADGVSSWNFNSSESALVVFHNGELDYVNPFDHNFNFITRRGNELLGPLLRMGLNNVFFSENNQIKALELDNRDRQNEFKLYDGANIKKFALDNDGKILVVLDGEKLKTILVR